MESCVRCTRTISWSSRLSVEGTEWGKGGTARLLVQRQPNSRARWLAVARSASDKQPCPALAGRAAGPIVSFGAAVFWSAGRRLTDAAHILTNASGAFSFVVPRPPIRLVRGLRTSSGGDGWLEIRPPHLLGSTGTLGDFQSQDKGRRRREVFLNTKS